MAFMAPLRTAAGESPLALRLRFMSWLRPVRRKWTRAAADSAVASARRGRNGGLLTLRALPVKGQREISSAHSHESGDWRRRRDAPLFRTIRRRIEIRGLFGEASKQGPMRRTAR